jgi:hypothetical protein
LSVHLIQTSSHDPPFLFKLPADARRLCFECLPRPLNVHCKLLLCSIKPSRQLTALAFKFLAALPQFEFLTLQIGFASRTGLRERCFVMSKLFLVKLSRCPQYFLDLTAAGSQFGISLLQLSVQKSLTSLQLTLVLQQPFLMHLFGTPQLLFVLRPHVFQFRVLVAPLGFNPILFGLQSSAEPLHFVALRLKNRRFVIAFRMPLLTRDFERLAFGIQPGMQFLSLLFQPSGFLGNPLLKLLTFDIDFVLHLSTLLFQFPATQLTVVGRLAFELFHFLNACRQFVAFTFGQERQFGAALFHRLLMREFLFPQANPYLFTP